MIRKRFLASLVTLPILAISACNSAVETIEVSQSTEATPVAVLTQPAPSQVPITPIFTPTNEFWWKTPPPPIPTLSFDLQDEFYNLLKTNGGCELPCLLGLRLQETQWKDATVFFDRYAYNNIQFLDPYISTETTEIHYASIETTKNVYMSMKIRFRLEVESEQIARIVLSTEGLVSPEQAPKDYLTRYSLREIFKKKGSPDAVYFEMGKGGIYGLQVVYEDEKIAIALSGAAPEGINGKYIVCPNLSDEYISAMTFALASPSDPIDIKSMLGPGYDGVASLERNAGINPNDFYELLISEKQPACFEASISEP